MGKQQWVPIVVSPLKKDISNQNMENKTGFVGLGLQNFIQT